MYQSRTIGKGIWLTRLPDGIELYFSPFREAGAALWLGFFGIACLIPGLFAAIALAPLAVSNAAGMIAIWLMSIFILPFIAFGVLFLTLAVYRLTNSLTVVVTRARIHTLRRILGFPVRKRRIEQFDVSGLDPVARVRYRWPRNAMAFYELVVRTRLVRLRDAKVTVAESLRGEETMEELRAEIAAVARLGDSTWANRGE